MLSRTQMRGLEMNPAFDKNESAKLPALHGSATGTGSAADTSEPLSGTTAIGTTITDIDTVEKLPTVDVPFTTLPDLIAHLDTRKNIVDSVTVGNVTQSRFIVICQALQERGRLFFLAKYKLLIITIPNTPHERLHLLLYDRIVKQISPMGLEDSWVPSGATRFPAGSSSGSTTSLGEGDSGGQPIPEREGRSAWPTLVIEAGFTQSLASLRTKMRFWFATSNHDVKIVILAKAFPQDSTQKRILIEQWQENEATIIRQGATRTRLSAMSPTMMLQPSCIQTIKIVWSIPGVTYEDASIALRRDLNSFNVVRGPLRLEFARLFLRPPTSPGEHDVILPDERLQWYASLIWVE
ncbi:dead deah box dna helicase [Ophiostoma piceae UAMH 11346]|uniref:Dead deah box dna helicase n=1 Tax=Ophiostoma piceae (strain UAMH 11346) TaxID=1262450 RepID=S3BQZ2_OPHP1|nr:dead deah box dna helicase [Ophiostoma piceae UAMH 11346]